MSGFGFERAQRCLERSREQLAHRSASLLTSAAMLGLIQVPTLGLAASARANESIVLSLTAVTAHTDAELVYSLTSGSGGAPANVSVMTQSGSGSRSYKVSHNGSLHITQAEAANLHLQDISCNGAVASVDVASRKVILEIASEDAVSCVFTNNAINQTATLTRQTLQRTATSLASGLPSTSNRVTERLSASIGVRKVAVPKASENAGEQKTAALIPLTGNGTDEAGSAKFSTALSDISEAKAREQAAMVRDTGLQLPGITVARSRFDGWVEGNIGYATNQEDNTSDAFSNFALGADYRMNESWLVGLMGNYSTMDSHTIATAPDISGEGWMVGPYAGYKINRQMFLSLKALHGVGETQYFATPDAPLSADGLASTRWLFDATLTGNWKAGNWTLTPSAQVMHLAERGSYIVHGESAGAVDAQADTGRVLFGPQISYEFAPTKSTRITPRAAVRGLWELEQVTVDDEGAANLGDQGLSTRVEAGIAVTSSKAKLDFSGSFEGLGDENESAASGKATLSMPLN